LSPRLAALLLAVLAALALGACGGEDGDEGSSFQEDYPALSERLVSLGEEVGQAIENANTETDQALADQFGEFAGQLDGLSQDLEELEPPEGLADERDDLVAAMNEVRTSLEGIASAAEDGDVEAAREATLELVEGSRELRDARQTLSRAVREGE
jgi:TolA-binding protein